LETSAARVDTEIRWPVMTAAAPILTGPQAVSTAPAASAAAAIFIEVRSTTTSFLKRLIRPARAR
jgi:hypothetical protein